ncbi:hypothetical protein [Fortiea contorta]|uniref:hypothetical protein n=1 Tax=Fortiea contorta TaxID=1892405 RepID=UPI00034C2929|nr:hypothetical protein [Fortiea contorta]
MEHWQFLIQKQGDRSWHPLESLNGEILQGRYRVLARSNRPNVDVYVRVTHSSTEELPPKRRIQKRSRRTNSEGLMAVLPFTDFLPGIWELQCSGDVMSDILGKSWQYSVSFSVVSSLAPVAVLDDGESQESDFLHLIVANTVVESPVPLDDTHPQTTEDAVIDQPVSPVWLRGDTAEQILQNLIDLALPSSETSSENETVEDNSAALLPAPLSLTLEREIYVARWGQPLTISGEVEVKADEPCVQNLYALELEIELRSPLKSTVLSQIRQPLTNQVPPFSIEYAIAIPAECESKLILADITLHGAFTDVGEIGVLASHAFTITADVTELLAIATTAQSHTPDFVEPETIPPAAQEPSVSLDLSLFNLVKSNKKEPYSVFQPSVNKPLPPLVNLRPKKSTASQAPQLPNLPPTPIMLSAENETGVALIAPAANPEEIADKNQAIAPINLDQLVIKNRLPVANSNIPYLKRLTAGSSAEIESSENPPSDTQPEDELVSEVAIAANPELIQQPVNQEATPLSSQLIIEGNPHSSPVIRKWLQSQGYILPEETHDTQLPTRQTISKNQVPLPAPPQPPIEYLNLFLEENTELEEQINTIIENPEAVETENTFTPPTDLNIEPEARASQSFRPLAPPLPPLPRRQKPPAWLAQEIVVDDTDELEAEEAENSTFAEPEFEISPTDAIKVDINQPLPVPQLYIPAGELIAGTAVKIRAELPDLPPQVVVKLWVEDYQTRYLLDGPHILKNLQPLSEGGLEVVTQLKIPFGCLEIRLEAIALDLVTQQESHKITIIRTVIPPNLPTLQLDELLGIGW